MVREREGKKGETKGRIELRREREDREGKSGVKEKEQKYE